MKATATPTSMNIEEQARQVVKAYKRAERANRHAARSVAEFASRLAGMGIKFEVVPDQEGGHSQSGRDQDEDGSKG